MPASIQAIQGFPVRPAVSIDRRRDVPDSILRLTAESSQEELVLAIQKVAADFYTPPPHWFTQEDQHRRFLGEAINHVGSAAFTPITTYSEPSADSTTGAAGVLVQLPGIDQTIVAPVPARLIVTMQWRVEYDIVGAGGTWIGDILINGAAPQRGRRVVWIPDAALQTLSFFSQVEHDLLPQTVYTVTAWHALGGGAAGTFIVQIGGLGALQAQTNMLCRVEPRIL